MFDSKIFPGGIGVAFPPPGIIRHQVTSVDFKGLAEVFSVLINHLFEGIVLCTIPIIAPAYLSISPISGQVMEFFIEFLKSLPSFFLFVLVCLLGVADFLNLDSVLLNEVTDLFLGQGLLVGCLQPVG